MNDVALLTVTPLDYGRSFLIGKGRTNEARFRIESRTRVIDEREGICEDFYQTASCKSENTFHDRDLFQRDNYDFLPIFSARYGLIFRRPAYLSARYQVDTLVRWPFPTSPRGLNGLSIASHSPSWPSIPPTLPTS